MTTGKNFSPFFFAEKYFTQLGKFKFAKNLLWKFYKVCYNSSENFFNIFKSGVL